MAERGRAPGRVQGIAETWPPRGGAQAGGFMRPGSMLGRRISTNCANGCAPKPAPDVCCRGCRSPSEPALPFISRPTTSRCCRSSPSPRQYFASWRSCFAGRSFFRWPSWSQRWRRALRRQPSEPRYLAHEVLARPALFGVAIGLCRDPRHSRTHRPVCAAGDADGRPALADKAGAGAAVGAQGHGA